MYTIIYIYILECTSYNVHSNYLNDIQAGVPSVVQVKILFKFIFTPAASLRLVINLAIKCPALPVEF